MIASLITPLELHIYFIGFFIAMGVALGTMAEDDKKVTMKMMLISLVAAIPSWIMVGVAISDIIFLLKRKDNTPK